MNMYFRTPYMRMGRHPMRRFANWEMAESDVFFPVDVKIGEDEFEVKALLPGLKAEDVSIQVVNETHVDVKKANFSGVNRDKPIAAIYAIVHAAVG